MHNTPLFHFWCWDFTLLDYSRCRRQPYCKKPCKRGMRTQKAKELAMYFAYIESAMHTTISKDNKDKEGEDGRTL